MDQDYRQGYKSSGFWNPFWHIITSRLVVASVIRQQKAALYHTPLKKGISLLLPDVLKGKTRMHWKRVRPHHRWETQQTLKHDFLRKSIKSIAESREGVVWKSNSTLSEFLLLFPSVFTVASCVGERILAQVALTDTDSILSLRSAVLSGTGTILKNVFEGIWYWF